ncbi:MAG: sulfatase-like hydrolase/transferase [Paludibacteraceae bacterium]|nr:sulfatase-like hydrolase/transferase [Paludibacteraceae bacterium]
MTIIGIIKKWWLHIMDVLWNHAKNHWTSYLTLVILTFLFVSQEFLCSAGCSGEVRANFWAAFFLGTMVLIIHRPWVDWMILTLVTVWNITLVIYYRANELILDGYAIFMAGNLKGFERSIDAYINWEVWLLAIIPVLYGIFLLFMPRKRTILWKVWLICMGLVVCEWMYERIRHFPTEFYREYKGNIAFYLDNGNSDTPFGQDHYFGRYGENWFIPFHEAYFAATCEDTQFLKNYFYSSGSLCYFPTMWVYYTAHVNNIVQPVPYEELQPYWNPTQTIPHPNTNVVLLLVESLENWPLNLGNYSQYIAPNLYKFCQNEHVAYIPNILSEVRHGVSADGQMLLNTGLLPIQNGATCMLYADNTFPNIASAYTYSALINPLKENSWNQKYMTPAFGYQIEIQPESGVYSDMETMHTLIQVLDTIHEPFCVMGITLDMHTPFSIGKNFDAQMPKGMPTYMHDYLGCYHYTDSCIGWLLDTIGQCVDMEHTTILITGDHTIFKSQLLSSFSKYAQALNLDVPKYKSSCPLIIYNPTFSHQKIEGIYYQIDTYPTLLAILGLKDHPWKGFGINLLDSVQRTQRDTVDEAYWYDLSNRIILNNTFQSTK